MRKDLAWSATLACTLGSWIAFPGLRVPSTMLLLAHGAILAWGIADIRSRFFVPALCRKAREPQRLALTFDDGPDPRITPDILELLATYRMPATFFVVASRAAQHPDLLKAIHEAGHTVACHDLLHSYHENFRGRKRMLKEIGAAQAIVADILKLTPRLYRPPVGLTNPHLGPALRALDMVCIGWSRSAGDRGNRSAARLRQIPALAQPGSVVLLHDTLPRPENKGLLLDGLRGLLEDIRARGLVACTVDGLFGVQPYR